MKKKMNAVEFVEFYKTLKEEVSRRLSYPTNSIELIDYTIDDNKNILVTVRTETGYEEVVINITPQPQPELKYFSLKCLVTGEIQRVGDVVHLFLLKDGVVLEEMYGIYNGQGTIGNIARGENYRWYNREFVTSLMLDEDPSNGIACISAASFNDVTPTLSSEHIGVKPTISSEHIVEKIENIDSLFKSDIIPFCKVYHGIS